MEKKTFTIDAEGKVLGRLATEVAAILRGKNRADFQPYLDMPNFVIVKNAAKIKLTGKKMEAKKYYHHTGFPGGLKAIPIEKVMAKDYRLVLRKAVMGMLPKNKLRAKQIKRLTIE